jgi:predicted membrane protein
MGGCEIDLRQAALPEGQPVVVDLFAMWGGIDLRIPGDWSVRNEAMAILGAVEDNRKEVSANPTRQIVIRGTAIMGGIEIKN